MVVVSTWKAVLTSSLGLLQRGLAAYESFKINLQRLIEMIRAINAIPVLGGVYPNNQFTPEHYMWLKQMKAEV